MLFSLISLAADPNAAYEKAKTGKAIIVDVREADEIKEGMIDKAVWFPLSKMKNDKNWKSEFEKMVKDKEIFLYCRSGRRSEIAKEILSKNGIKSENIGGYEDLKKILKISLEKKY